MKNIYNYHTCIFKQSQNLFYMHQAPHSTSSHAKFETNRPRRLRDITLVGGQCLYTRTRQDIAHIKIPLQLN